MFYNSMPSLGVYYFLSLTLSVDPSVCLSVTDKLQIDSSFFCFSMKSSHFLAVSTVLLDPLYKTLFFDF